MANELISNLLFDVTTPDNDGNFSDVVYDGNLRWLAKYVHSVKSQDLARSFDGNSLVAVCAGAVLISELVLTRAAASSYAEHDRLPRRPRRPHRVGQ